MKNSLMSIADKILGLFTLSLRPSNICVSSSQPMPVNPCAPRFLQMPCKYMNVLFNFQIHARIRIVSKIFICSKGNTK